MVHGRIVLAALLLAVLSTACAPEKQSRKEIPHGPLVYLNEIYAESQYGHRMRAYLNAKKFDRLETIADSLERNDIRWPSGRRGLDSFYQAFTELDDNQNADAWEKHLHRLRQWRKTRDRSLVARYALCYGILGRGWAARGGDWARNVSRQQWARYGNDLEEAGRLIRLLPDAAHASYEWHSLMLKVLHGSGQDSLYRELANVALERFPKEPRFYVGIAGHLLPRWYGVPGEWEEFAEEETRRVPAPLSDELYARIVTEESRYAKNVFRESPSLSWDRTKHGLEAWHDHFPMSPLPGSSAARLAWMAGDRDYARKWFAELADTMDVEVWQDPKFYWAAREWAAADDL